MVRQRFIEKHSKASKSLYKTEGSLFEKFVSLILHKQTVPILIDPHFLRKLDLGQVDCCYIKNEKIYVIECKTGKGLLSNQQKMRLVKASDFLSLAFNKESILLKFRAVAKTGSGHYSFKISNIKEYN